MFFVNKGQVNLILPKSGQTLEQVAEGEYFGEYPLNPLHSLKR
jgi:hypothetical protein